MKKWIEAVIAAEDDRFGPLQELLRSDKQPVPQFIRDWLADRLSNEWRPDKLQRRALEAALEYKIDKRNGLHPDEKFKDAIARLVAYHACDAGTLIRLLNNAGGKGDKLLPYWKELRDMLDL
jgi:hypothetical protein